MTEKRESNPFAALLKPDLYAEWRTNLKRMLISSFETNEKMAKASLAWYEKTMSWTKDTPWAPWCKSFVTTAEKFIDEASHLAHEMWHIERARDGPEKMARM